MNKSYPLAQEVQTQRQIVNQQLKQTVARLQCGYCNSRSASLFLICKKEFSCFLCNKRQNLPSFPLQLITIRFLQITHQFKLDISKEAYDSQTKKINKLIEINCPKVYAEKARQLLLEELQHSYYKVAIKFRLINESRIQLLRCNQLIQQKQIVCRIFQVINQLSNKSSPVFIQQQTIKGIAQIVEQLQIKSKSKLSAASFHVKKTILNKKTLFLASVVFFTLFLINVYVQFKVQEYIVQLDKIKQKYDQIIKAKRKPNQSAQYILQLQRKIQALKKKQLITQQKLIKLDQKYGSCAQLYVRSFTKQIQLNATIKGERQLLIETKAKLQQAQKGLSDYKQMQYQFLRMKKDIYSTKAQYDSIMKFVHENKNNMMFPTNDLLIKLQFWGNVLNEKLK